MKKKNNIYKIPMKHQEQIYKVAYGVHVLFCKKEHPVETSKNECFSETNKYILWVLDGCPEDMVEQYQEKEC